MILSGLADRKAPRILADLTGNGTVDIIGFAEAGVYVSLNNGRGLFHPTPKVLDSFGINSGWQVNKNPRFITDLTGDKRGDIIGFGDANVTVSFNNGNGTPGKASRSSTTSVSSRDGKQANTLDP